MSDDGRCDDCGRIIVEEDYVNGYCRWCGQELEDE
jgi:predicted RNA-binding Zn-ribbon protein involved in translation (DUF1610 family)